MGNRAVITDKAKKVGLYLHWCGGRNSIEAFLLYCKLKDYRGFGYDSEYALARLAQVVGNFFGGTCSVGITTRRNGEDNGTYIVNGWDIVDHLDLEYDYETEEYKEVPFTWYSEDFDYDYILEFLEEINNQQPSEEQLTEEELVKGIEKLKAKKAIGD